MNDRSNHAPAAADEDAPLTPDQEKFLRRVRLIAVMGAVIIFAGFGLVLFTIVTRMSNPQAEKAAISPETLGDFTAATQALQPGERIVSATTSGDLLTLIVSAGPGTDRVLVLKLSTLEPVREVRTGQ